mmetsp:Transcript_76825/g.242797  ORF Transcript_76825/g.242797 Transcript_76825/m.242797 type:complete len:82 (+) Transcript_76825:320-565(+)
MHPRRPRQALPQGKTPQLRWPLLGMVRSWDQCHWSPGTGIVPPTVERRLQVQVGALNQPLPEANLPGLVDRAHRQWVPAVA